MPCAEWKPFMLEATKMLLDARPVANSRLTVDALTTTRYWYKGNWYGNTRRFIRLDDAKRHAKTETGNSVTIYTYEKNTSKIVCFAEASGYCPP